MSEVRAYTPKVTMVPATLNRFTAAPIATTQKRRVAAYARVSTDEEEQLTSYAAQVDYYTRYIQSKDEWAFIKVYTDEGITGTSIKKRDGFNQMVQDALTGGIDLIITKSVSRFARNTVDSLTTVRMLKDRGVEVYFEKENIYTLDSKGELLITIISSLAQEESRSISENVTWGMRKRFADGKVALPYKHFLGYRKGDDDLPEIVPEEAEIVRDIFRMFLEGKAPSYIARNLTASGIPSPAGKASWRPETVKSILTNEKYKGDALLQKTFCTDFLTKRMKTNEGEVPQYYVENSHPAIIAPEIFDAVQAEMVQRKQPGRRNYTPHCFSGKIYCDECGALYGSKTWHGDVAWRCNARHSGATKCKTPALRSRTIEDAFVIAFNRVIARKDEILQICERIMTERCDVTEINEKLASLHSELEVLAELIQRHISANAHVAMNQVEYNRQFNEYETRSESIKENIAVLENQRATLSAKLGAIRQYTETLRGENRITGFDERLWYGTVEQVRILANGKIRFIFKGGSIIEG